MAIFDPTARPDPERHERQRATAGQVEIRPARRTAHLAVRSLACPSCGVPVVTGRSIGFSDLLFCAFCDDAAPVRDYLQEQGWPQVDLVARL